MAWRKPSNLREWGEILLRHKKKFVFTSLPMAVIVIVASHYVERKYTASAVMEIRSDLTIQQINDKVTSQAAGRMRSGRLLTQDLTSPRAIRQVIEDLNLTQDLSHTADGELTHKGQMIRSDMVDRMQKNIGVKYLASDAGTHIVRISFTDADRQMAHKVVKKLVDNYISNAQSRFDKQLVATKKFFQSQVARFRVDRKDAEEKLILFNSQHAGLDPDDPASVETKLVALKMDLMALDREIKILKQEIEATVSWVGDQPETLSETKQIPSPELQLLLEQKRQYQKTLYSFLNRNGSPTDKHPRAIRLRKTIAELDARIAVAQGHVEVTEQMMPNATRLEALRDIKVWKGKLVALEAARNRTDSQIVVYDHRRRNFVALRNEYLNMQRDRDDSHAQFEFWSDRLQDVTLALQAAYENRSVSLSLIEPPREHLKPSHPTLANILVLALVLGGGAGIAMIVLAEMLDRSFHSVQHAVDDLKLPVLGAVDEILTPPMMFRRKIFGWGVYPTLGTALAVALAVSIGLANLSLIDPARFEQLVNQPGRVIKAYLFGDADRQLG